MPDRPGGFQSRWDTPGGYGPGATYRFLMLQALANSADKGDRYTHNNVLWANGSFGRCILREVRAVN
jgi:hypothetical protein